MSRTSSSGLKGPIAHPFCPAPQSRTTVSSKENSFGDVVYESPPDSLVESPADSESESERDYFEEEDSAGALSDSTLEDVEDIGNFGHPLERMPRLKSADHGLHYDSNESVKALLYVAVSGSAYSSRSHSPSSIASSAASATFDSKCYERVVDHLIDLKPDPFASAGHRNLVMFDPPLHFHRDSVPPLMVKRLHRTSPELILLLEVNLPEPREDPWNAAPRILHAVERGEYVFLCMQRLSEYDKPPLVNVAHYIDFFRQVLEGLSFLHEERIVGLNCAHRSSYMVDLSSAPRTPAPAGHADYTNMPLPTIQFDRFTYPVRYYFANFSDATRVHKEPKYSGSSPPTPAREVKARSACPFKCDMQECGEMFNSLLVDIPQVASKFKSLTKAMITGGFTADDSRRLFDALCHSLDAKMFESTALTHVLEPTPSEETQTGTTPT